MEKFYRDSETGCCPRFDPAPWDEKEMSFKDELFLKDRVISLFHIPLNFGQVMKRDMEKIQKAGALAPKPLMLADSSSLWGTDVYIAVAKEVPGAKMERISGTFLTKVFEGEYKNMGKWTKDMNRFVKAKDKAMKKMYFFYTTCPPCAKYYSKNYTVILVEV
jgi:hypothetical protein